MGGKQWEEVWDEVVSARARGDDSRNARVQCPAFWGGAAEHACPVPPLYSYTNFGRSAEWDALCEGDLEFNGFYGYGIVDA